MFSKLKDDHLALSETNTANENNIKELTKANKALIIEKDELLVKEDSSLK